MRPAYILFLNLLLAPCWGTPAYAQITPGRAGAVECALPVIVRSGVRDIHESWFNGPEGYAFIVEMGAEKVGDLPAEVGRDPVRRFDASVYASNFQGPILVRHAHLRPQWEWTAAGETQISDRSYPLLAARACVTGASTLPALTLHVAEHDEWPFANDPGGSIHSRPRTLPGDTLTNTCERLDIDAAQCRLELCRRPRRKGRELRRLRSVVLPLRRGKRLRGRHRLGSTGGRGIAWNRG